MDAKMQGMILTVVLLVAVALLLALVLWRPPTLRRFVGRWGGAVRVAALFLVVGLAAARVLKP